MSNIKTLIAGAMLALVGATAFAQASPAASMPRVDKREANQDTRIQNGVASGQLNAKETYKLEEEQAAVNKAETHAKADGKVTKGERRHLHRMQNRASRDIHAQKHDAQTAQTVKP
jgi:methionine-rich copper-binding protein CopC